MTDRCVHIHQPVTPPFFIFLLKGQLESVASANITCRHPGSCDLPLPAGVAGGSSCPHGGLGLRGVAGLGLLGLPDSERPAEEPNPGPAHLPERRRSTAPPVNGTGDAAKEGLPASSAPGAGLLLAALAGPPQPAHLLPGLQALEQGRNTAMERQRELWDGVAPSGTAALLQGQWSCANSKWK